MTTYRVGNHQPQNLYRGDTYIGVMFNPIDAAAVVRHLNMGLGECTCASYEPCHGECCGVGMCSCSATDEEIARAEEGLGLPVVDSCTCSFLPGGTDPACIVHQGRRAHGPKPPPLGPGCICDGSGRTCPRHGAVI